MGNVVLVQMLITDQLKNAEVDFELTLKIRSKTLLVIMASDGDGEPSPRI